MACRWDEAASTRIQGMPSPRNGPFRQGTKVAGPRKLHLACELVNLSTCQQVEMQKSTCKKLWASLLNGELLTCGNAQMMLMTPTSEGRGGEAGAWLCADGLVHPMRRCHQGNLHGSHTWSIRGTSRCCGPCHIAVQENE